MEVTVLTISPNLTLVAFKKYGGNQSQIHLLTYWLIFYLLSDYCKVMSLNSGITWFHSKFVGRIMLELLILGSNLLGQWSCVLNWWRFMILQVISVHYMWAVPSINTKLMFSWLTSVACKKKFCLHKPAMEVYQFWWEVKPLIGIFVWDMNHVASILIKNIISWIVGMLY